MVGLVVPPEQVQHPVDEQVPQLNVEGDAVVRGVLPRDLGAYDDIPQVRPGRLPLRLGPSIVVGASRERRARR